MDVEFSPDDAQVASAITNNVFLWKTGNENPIIKLRHKEYVDSIAFSPDGRLIATGSRDSHVYLWNVQDGQLSSTLAGHADMVESVAFSPDGQRLASGSVDGAVCIWRVQDGALEKTLRERKEGVNSTSVYGLAFSPDGLLLAVVGGGHDGTIRLWNVKDGKLLAVIRGHQDGVYSVLFQRRHITGYRICGWYSAVMGNCTTIKKYHFPANSTTNISSAMSRGMALVFAASSILSRRR
jgi:WD40 repeat protein